MDVVIEFYGKYETSELIEMALMEDPYHNIALGHPIDNNDTKAFFDKGLSLRTTYQDLVTT